MAVREEGNVSEEPWDALGREKGIGYRWQWTVVELGDVLQVDELRNWSQI